MLLSEKVKNLFPIKTIKDVLNLFRQQLENNESEPNLTLLSIVVGCIEQNLCSRVLDSSSSAKEKEHIEVCENFPVINYDVIEALYKKFKTVLASIDKCSQTGEKKYATREIIKKVSDVIWNSLMRSSYKDRAHLQSLFSYLEFHKLDCFGVALAVVAGCQMLGYMDVHLAISEDHVWVVFGKTGDETIEVTWHGKGAEDKRGQSVSSGIESQTWLYVAGNPVVCDRYIEVAAIVSAINPSLNSTSACAEVADLQQQLLWILYDMGHLKRYPMALGCLGELEEVQRTQGRLTCEELYNESVKSAQVNYKNHHVYPYTYQGGYYYRRTMYREAFQSWADSSDVIRLYNYSRDDEEIYKEFMDIANELIPQVMKLESSGHSAKSILRDAFCFANLLRFYDGICKWEECSLTPILHIGWAKPLVATIAKFEHEIRMQVIIKCHDENHLENGNIHQHHHQNNEKSENNLAITNNNNILTKPDANISQKEKAKDKDNKKDDLPKSLDQGSCAHAWLVEKCGEKLLNPDFLLQGGGQPFTSENTLDGEKSNDKEAIKDETEEKKTVENGGEKKEEKAEKKVLLDNNDAKKKENKEVKDLKESNDKKKNEDQPKRPMITLYSQKMKGLKDLLLAEKLNTNAISLQITAQSQVQVGGKKSRLCTGAGIENEASARSKRARRE